MHQNRVSLHRRIAGFTVNNYHPTCMKKKGDGKKWQYDKNLIHFLVMVLKLANAFADFDPAVQGAAPRHPLSSCRRIEKVSSSCAVGRSKRKKV